MIIVSINNKEAELREGMTIEELLESLGNTKAAVWINGEQLLKSGYISRIVGEGDEIKILRISAGG